MDRYLVTGGAGFIGSNLVEALLNGGNYVRILDNFSTGKQENLELVQAQTQAGDRLEVLEGDLRSYHTVNEVVQGIDFILHQGALPSVPRSVRDPLSSNETNVVGTLNLLHAAQKAGVKRLVYASSSSVYGSNPGLPKVESMAVMPRSPYAISKLAAEQYCSVFWQLYGFETVSLRYFNVFGPRQDPHSIYSAVIPKFITAALQDQPVTIYGDGQQSRDFTYVANVVNANLLACHAPKAAGCVMNVSCGQRYSLLDLAAQLERLLGKTIAVNQMPPRAGDVKHSQADISLAREILGYEPAVDFGAGLARTIDWYCDHLYIGETEQAAPKDRLPLPLIAVSDRP
jgi:UDP-glucose 4-epimerase